MAAEILVAIQALNTYSTLNKGNPNLCYVNTISSDLLLEQFFSIVLEPKYIFVLNNWKQTNLRKLLFTFLNFSIGHRSWSW
jgi:hypothetical protein